MESLSDHEFTRAGLATGFSHLPEGFLTDHACPAKRAEMARECTTHFSQWATREYRSTQCYNPPVQWKSEDFRARRDAIRGTYEPQNTREPVPASSLVREDSLDARRGRGSVAHAFRKSVDAPEDTSEITTQTIDAGMARLDKVVAERRKGVAPLMRNPWVRT